MAKGFVVGLMVGILLLAGGLYFYFASGMAPTAATDPPMPFERILARIALRAHIEKQSMASPAVAADEPNFLAGAKVYKDNCAVCHGLPGQTGPAIAENMFPHAPALFRGKGVTDDPISESYWKTANGIRLSGMPSFKKTLSEVQLWQVNQLLVHANQLPDSVKNALMPEPSPAAQAAAPVPTKTAAPKRK